jgi:uncharacterized DUF497 family protein
MEFIDWNTEKNSQLKRDRGVSFEDVVWCIETDAVLDDMVHPNRERYPHQRLLVVALAGYAYLVPYVATESGVFLKTIIPSRKATKRYLGGHDE